MNAGSGCGEQPDRSPVAAAGLPRTWRPRRARLVSLSIAVVVVVVFTVIAVILPAEGAGAAAPGDRIALVVVGLAVAAFLARHAGVRITADRTGLEVKNLLRSRRLAWAEVIAVSLRRGDPWAMLDLADGTSLAAMGIQASDGPAASVAARDLAVLVDALGGPPTDPGPPAGPQP